MNTVFRRISVTALVAAFAFMSAASAADRSANDILADYDALKAPHLDSSKKTAELVQEYRMAVAKIEKRKDDLAMELFRAHPEHPRVPALLRARWVNTMMDRATAAATVNEIDQAMPLFKDKESSREASFMKVIATIRANPDTPEAALGAVDEFIRRDSKDQRCPVLLSGFASEVSDAALRGKLLKRLVAEYPDHPAAKAAELTLALLDRVGKPLSLDFNDAITGSKVSISGLKGKVVVLDFWATWCGPCVGEMPRMKKIYAQYRDKGVEFIGVSLDAPKEEGGLDKLKAFVAKNEIQWPQYHQGNGWESEFSTKLGIASIPQLFLVDAEGRLASIDARDTLESLIPEYLEKARARHSR
jgi:thiol-disulfide isomerase/thioredoxin